MGQIEQDSGAIITAAGAIRGDAAEFMVKVDAFYDLITQNIKESEGGLWNGPRATAFLANVNAKKATFTSAKTNLDNLANNLEEQGKAWQGFEGGAA